MTSASSATAVLEKAGIGKSIKSQNERATFKHSKSIAANAMEPGMNWFKRFFCEHHFEFVRNIYGDEIIDRGWKRSIWQCNRCGKTEDRDELHKQ